MFKNYLKITLRNLRKQTGYSAINICGLALGIACCIIMLLCVHCRAQLGDLHRGRSYSGIDRAAHREYARDSGSPG